jgi:hypothetical protein
MRSASARIPSGLQSVTDARLPQVNGLSAFATGLAFVPMRGAVLPVNLIAPRVTERIGAPRLTSTLLGSVAKSRSGIAAGVLTPRVKPAACSALPCSARWSVSPPPSSRGYMPR